MKNCINCVYKFIDNSDNIIYVGKAKRLTKRVTSKGHISKHLPTECYNSISKIKFIQLDTEDDMDLAEKYFINKYKPRYNSVHSTSNLTITIQYLERLEWLDIKQKVERPKSYTINISFKNNTIEYELYKWLKSKNNPREFIKQVIREDMERIYNL